jgi:trigger factor
MKTFIRNYINDTYVRDSNITWENKVQEELINKTRFEKVEALVEKELQKRIDNYKSKFSQIGMNADDYLEKSNITEESLRNEWKPQAEKDVKLEILLQSYGVAKNIEPTAEEIEENLKGIDQQTRTAYNNDEAQLKALIRYYYINQKAYIDIVDTVRKNSGLDAVTQNTEDKPKANKTKKGEK